MTTIILTYGLAEQSLYNRENNTSIKGSWLYELAKKYAPNKTEEKISLIGLDTFKRIEIRVSVSLFEQLKNDPVFILRAENLRRIRSDNMPITLLEYLINPRMRKFDNDLDAITL